MKNCKKGFIEIVVIALIALGLLGGGYYMRTHTKSSLEDRNATTTEDTVAKTNDSIKVEQELKYQQWLEQKQSTISIQFKAQTKEVDVLSLKNSLGNMNGVASLVYTSANEGLLNFKERHTGDSDVLKRLDELGYNPVGAKIIIKLKSSSAREAVIGSIKSSEQYPSVETVN